jgi:hypothetical protein
MSPFAKMATPSAPARLCFAGVVSVALEAYASCRMRAADYEQAAADPSLPTNVRTRFVLIANHYRVLADWDERTERARWRATADARQIPACYRYAAE